MSAAMLIFLLLLAGLMILWLPGGPGRTQRGSRLAMASAAAEHAGSRSTSASDDDGEISAAEQRPVDGPVARLMSVLTRGRRRRAEAGEWVDWVRQLAALVRAGQSAAAVFAVSARTAAEAPAPSAAVLQQEQVSRAVARGAALGRSPAQTLRQEAETAAASRAAEGRTRTAVLIDLARCWEVSERTGAPLAALLEGLAEAAEADLDADAARETALAGARATVKILSWLPVLALGLGMLIGADPVRTLLTTPWGMAAGAAGAVLSILGRVWTQRLVHRAEQAADGGGSAAGRKARRREAGRSRGGSTAGAETGAAMPSPVRAGAAS